LIEGQLAVDELAVELAVELLDELLDELVVDKKFDLFFPWNLRFKF
jgi:hypothetical protein